MVRNTKNIKADDIVYIYLSTPVQKIKWKCQVIKSGYYMKSYTDGSSDDYSFIQTDEYDDGPLIELRPIVSFEDGMELEYHTLKGHGLKSRLMGPQKVKDELLEYITQIEKHLLDNKSTDEGYIAKIPKTVIEKYAKADSDKPSSIIEVKTKTYNRSQYIAQYAKNRAKGYCQLCGCKAPFKDKYGQPYLESHHLKWLSKGGKDSIYNVVALCPNCHRKMHVVNDIDDLEYLLDKIK